MSQKLENYLRAYRKRSGFSQDEVAFLLGVKSASKVSRHERYRRQPSLRTAFAYEVLFGIPVRAIFAGLYEPIEERIRERAVTLAKDVSTRMRDRQKKLKLRMLEGLLIPTSTPRHE